MIFAAFFSRHGREPKADFNKNPGVRESLANAPKMPVIPLIWKNRGVPPSEPHIPKGARETK
jgi:hypothetical protein